MAKDTRTAKSGGLADYLMEISLEKWEQGPPKHETNREFYAGYRPVEQPDGTVQKIWTPEWCVEGAMRFFDEVTQFTPRRYQAEIVEEMIHTRRLAVRGPRGLGKSAIASNVILWFGSCFDPCKIGTTAGTWLQLEGFLWPEIHLWAGKADWSHIGCKPILNQLDFTVNPRKLDKPVQMAIAVNAEKPQMMEGMHSKHVLFVFDEAKMIPDGVFNAVEGTLSKGFKIALVISTPGAQTGRFYQIHTDRVKFKGWAAKHVSDDEMVAALEIESPEEAEDFKRWREQMKLEWGEESELYQNHVKGEFADAGDDHIIPHRHIMAAVERWKVWRDAGFPEPETCHKGLGVDTAGQGKDKTCIAFRVDNGITRISYEPKSEPMQTANRIMQLAPQWPNINIEVDGAGSGPMSRCQEMKRDEEEQFRNVRLGSIVAGGGTDNETDQSGELRFVNMRSMLWWRMREMLHPDSGYDLMLPDDQTLISDLSAPKYENRAGGKIFVESKVDIRKRIGRSTDAADSVILAFADRVTPVLLTSIRVETEVTKQEHGRIGNTFYDNPRPWPTMGAGW